MKNIFIVSLALFSVLFLANSFNAIPIADDFRNYVMARDLGALGFAVDYYLTWSGRFLTILFIGLTSKILPIENLNIASVLLGLMFLGFIYLMAKLITQESPDKINKFVVMAFLLIITWFAYRTVLGRVISWFSGGMVYMFWYAFIPLFIAEFIKNYNNKTYSWKLVALCLLLANSIETVPPAMIFFMATYLLVKNEFFHKEPFKYFFFLALLITVASFPLLLAPGNFARAKTIVAYDTHTVSGLFSSYLNVAKIFFDCARNTLFLTIPLALISSFFLDKASKTSRIQLGICFIGAAIGSALPMGFASEHNGARPASLFVFFTCFGVFSILSASITYPKFEKHKQMITSVLLIITCFFVAADFQRGLAPRANFVQTDQLLKAPSSLNQDMVIKRFKGKTPRSLNFHDITYDKTHWMNVSLAEFYRNKSVRLEE